MNKKKLKTSLLLFALSFGIRLLYFVVVKGVDAEVHGDEGGYIALGKFILGTAPDNFYIFRAPLSGFIFAPFFLLFNSSPFTARLVNIFLSSLCAPLIYKISFLKFNNNKISKYLSLFWTVYPPSIFYASMITSETLAGLLILLLSLFIVKNEKKISYKNFLAIGFLCGLTSLTRSSYYYLPIFIVIYYVFSSGFTLNYIKMYLVFIFTFYMTISPLIFYNHYKFDAFIPSEPRLGYGLYLCNNDLNQPEIIKGGYYRDDYLINRRVESGDLKKIYLQDIALKDKTLDYMLQNKSKLIVPMINRYINFWSFRPNPIKSGYTINDIIMFFIWIPIFLTYMFSLVKERKNSRNLFNLIIFYTSITVIPFWGIPRFRFPVDSLILIQMTLFLKKRLFGKR